jgi:hypothetical protein
MPRAQLALPLASVPLAATASIIVGWQRQAVQSVSS